MKRILSDCDNSLNALGKMSIKELMDYKGIGEAKAISILAACELGKRRQSEEVAQRKDLGSAHAIYQFMRPKMQDLDVEEAWVVLLNHNYKLIKAERISRGGITETAVDVRLIVKSAVLNNATTQQGRRPPHGARKESMRGDEALHARPRHRHRRSILQLPRAGKTITHYLRERYTIRPHK